MPFVVAGGTLEDKRVLAEFVAELQDFGIFDHNRFLTGSCEGVHPVLAHA
jgi:hypothetical protein